VFVCELQVVIGNAEYLCSCVRYVSSDDILVLIVVLTILLALLILLLISTIVALRQRRKNKQAKAVVLEEQYVPKNSYDTLTAPDNETKHYQELESDYADIRSPGQPQNYHYNKRLPEDYSDQTSL